MKSTVEEKNVGKSMAEEEINRGKPSADDINLRKSKGEEINFEEPTSDLAGLTFRTTTAEDYDDVISVRRHLYDGTDYIPYRYYELLEHNTGFAGFIDCTMVCFMFAAVIDDGRSIHIQSIRVREEYEGRGIYSRLRTFCLKKLNTTARKSVYVIESPTSNDQLIKKSVNLVFIRRSYTRNRITESLLFLKRSLKFESTKGTLRSMLGPRHASSLEKVDVHYLVDLFRDKSATQYLFPENIIVVYWIPYELVPSNIGRMFMGTKMLSSVTPIQDPNSKTVPPMISAITVDQCEAGSVIKLDLFGDISNEEIITDHIYTQLERVVDTCSEILILYIDVQQHVNTDTLQHVLSNMGWKMVYDDVMYGLEKYI
ncbi:histidine N-acetyltransferase-like [Argopecten irradians]|uniref:histidine N-acetyltransferase-like n=1 Tax=Argopecten irradians TaxID=31199 RepID=UPI003713DC79